MCCIVVYWGFWILRGLLVLRGCVISGFGSERAWVLDVGFAWG